MNRVQQIAKAASIIAVHVGCWSMLMQAIFQFCYDCELATFHLTKLTYPLRPEETCATLCNGEVQKHYTMLREGGPDRCQARQRNAEFDWLYSNVTSSNMESDTKAKAFPVFLSITLCNCQVELTVNRKFKSSHLPTCSFDGMSKRLEIGGWKVSLRGIKVHERYFGMKKAFDCGTPTPLAEMKTKGKVWIVNYRFLKAYAAYLKAVESAVANGSIPLGEL
ncbi:hypothetical protein BCR37DRAFT_384169 [Protomyces lactucae-debilis]|uniref:Uncharacterized protein n=1 Tax=Protomyces lactucae-debilis TaxID=2754530 RepID=A0A1Y2EWB9_PROLT|nr:uncharacterized protein BCR37DRAFT_384169 [Protomyces lactucae-debilis]ORY75115.1 hypothetical protein BCR37DRAFT_384169 [Protomyces lactucae-debilis]